MQDFFIHQTKNHAVLGGVVALSDFTTDAITVRVKGGMVTVKGKGLIIDRFDANEMQINGHIDEVGTHAMV